jgi:hypothetical protein
MKEWHLILANYKRMFNNIESPPEDGKKEKVPTEHKKEEPRNTMTSDEYELRKINPYDLSDVHKVLGRNNNRKR